MYYTLLNLSYVYLFTQTLGFYVWTKPFLLQHDCVLAYKFTDRVPGNEKHPGVVLASTSTKPHWACMGYARMHKCFRGLGQCYKKIKAKISGVISTR